MKVITPGILKLIRYAKDFSDRGLFPVSAQIMPTNKCNFNCFFCSESSRDKSKEIGLDDLVRILDGLAERGCRGIEITGGGEPTLYKDFDAIIHYILDDLGMSLGLVTNGSNLRKFTPDFFSKFSWVRVSLNASKEGFKSVHGVDVYDNVFEGLRCLDTAAGQFGRPVYGISYIYSPEISLPINIYSLANDIIANGLSNMVYLRLAKDVLSKIKVTKHEADEIKSRVSSILSGSEISVDFQVNRDYSVPSECIMYKIKPVFSADGFVYPCCIAQYKKIHRLCQHKDYFELLDSKEETSIDTKKCPYCIYGEINNLAIAISNSEVINPSFI